MAIYTVTPHHDSLVGGEIIATSYREARRIAADFRDNYHQSVMIERDGVALDWWRRSQEGDGSKWYRAVC